jgi:hypothetical protein
VSFTVQPPHHDDVAHWSLVKVAQVLARSARSEWMYFQIS